MTNTLLTTLSARSLQAHHEAGHWTPATIYREARRQAERDGERAAVVELHRTVSYAHLLGLADRLAGRLSAAGLRPGDRVAVWLPSRLEVAVALLACSRNGYVVCPSLHRDHTVAEVTGLLERMRAAALLVQPDHGADAERVDVLERVDGLDALRLVIGLPPARDTPVDEVADGAPPPEDAGPGDPDTVVYLAFTSGSTGRPKGVMHSDNTLLAPARAMVRDWRLGDALVAYSLSPLSHNLGFGALVMALAHGGTLVVHDLPRQRSLADRLAETGATFALGVPTHAVDLLAELVERPTGRLERLRGFRISGAAVPTAVAEGLLAAGVVPQSGYGMTEGGSHHYTRPDDDAELIVGSSGRPFSGHEARVFAQDDPDRALDPGEIGQLGGRGPSLMLGYYDDQEQTETSHNADGWFLSGDLGWVDEAGNVRITGRKKDLIIRGGHNIFPARIEALALRHPDIAAAAAVPQPDERLGEKVCLVIATEDGAPVDEDDLLRHLDREGLSKYDMPELLVHLDDLPLLPSGKLDKRRLADQLTAGELAPTPVRFRTEEHSTAR